jgi:hypothetical protein
VFKFEDGGTLVATGSIGQGQFVLLSDPSVLINRMLQFEGNLQFSINLLRFLARRGESDRLVILAGDINLHGRPRNMYDDGTFKGKAGAFATAFDNWLDELNLYLLTATSLKVLGVILALLAGFLVFLLLPSRNPPGQEGDWTHAGGVAAMQGFQGLVRHYDGSQRISYLLPAAIVRDNVNTALEIALGQPDPLFSMRENELIETVKNEIGPETGQLLSSLLPRFRAIPQRAQAASPWQSRFLPRREFEALHSQSERLYRTLDPQPETKRW